MRRRSRPRLARTPRFRLGQRHSSSFRRSQRRGSSACISSSGSSPRISNERTCRSPRRWWRRSRRATSTPLVTRRPSRSTPETSPSGWGCLRTFRSGHTSAVWFTTSARSAFQRACCSRMARLTLEERRQMQEHPAIGEAILKKVDLYADVAIVVRHHHERIDGEGYPDRLAGDDIPLALQDHRCRGRLQRDDLQPRVPGRDAEPGCPTCGSRRPLRASSTPRLWRHSRRFSPERVRSTDG